MKQTNKQSEAQDDITQIEREFFAMPAGIRLEALGVAFRYGSICGVIASMQNDGAMEGGGDFSEKFAIRLLHAVADAAGLSTSSVYAAHRWFGLHLDEFLDAQAFKEREVRKIAAGMVSHSSTQH